MFDKKDFLRFIGFVLALYVSQAYASAEDDDHLLSTDQTLSDDDSFGKKMHYVFSDAERDDVVFKVLAQFSFSAETVAGVRRTALGDEAFLIEPSVRLGLYERLERYEAQKLGGPRVYTMNEESYQNLKREIGTDYRNVKVSKKSVPIPTAITDRILAVWTSALTEVKPREEPGIYIDGGWLTFFVPRNERGAVSGTVSIPSDNTKMSRLWGLADSLRKYGSGEASVSELEQALVLSEADF